MSCRHQRKMRKNSNRDEAKRKTSRQMMTCSKNPKMQLFSTKKTAADDWGIFGRDDSRAKDDKKVKSLQHPGFPRGHPSLVLTEPDVALLRRSDESRCFLRGMAVDKNLRSRGGFDGRISGSSSVKGMCIRPSRPIKISQRRVN